MKAVTGFLLALTELRDLATPLDTWDNIFDDTDNWDDIFLDTGTTNTFELTDDDFFN